MIRTPLATLCPQPCWLATGARPADAFSSARQEHTLWGSRHLPATLSGLTFQISPSAFFQTNSSQAELLHEAIARLAGEQFMPVLECES